MRFLVTAGPAYEPLDEVRRLTNFSTGKLGTQLAAFLAGQHHDVHLLRSDTAVYSAPAAGVTLETFSTSLDLRQALEARGREPFDAVFHAAAVSDFKVRQIWQVDSTGAKIPAVARKIPSQAELWVQLAPAEKIIASLRGWFPKAFIAGWKYEVEGGRDTALARAADQVEQYRVDASIANGPAYGLGFGIVLAKGTASHHETAEVLFSELLKIIADKAG